MKVVLELSTALYRLGLGKLPCVNSMRCPKGPRSMGSNDNHLSELTYVWHEIFARVYFCAIGDFLCFAGTSNFCH